MILRNYKIFSFVFFLNLYCHNMVWFYLALLEKGKPEYKIGFRRIKHKLELNPEIKVPNLFMLLANKVTKIYHKK